MTPAGSDTQNRTVIGWLAAGLLAYLVFLVVRPLLVPLGWAAVIAVVFSPLYARFARRWSATRAAAVTTVLVAVLVIGPLFAIGTAFVNEALGAAHDFQGALAEGQLEWMRRVSNAWLERIPAANRPDLASAALGAAQNGALALAAYSGAILRNAVTFVFDLLLALFASFFLLRDSAAILKIIRRILPLDEAQRDRLMAETTDLITVSVRSSVMVAGLQGLLGGLVFAAVGIDGPVFWGVVMAGLCLLPLGAWVVWLPAAIMLAVGGQVGRAIVVGVLGIGIVSSVDNFLRPMLMTGGTSMNGLVVFVSLLGGVAAFGALGLVLGPVLVATAAALVLTYRDAAPRTSAKSPTGP